MVNDISSQVFNNFFSASDIMGAVRGRFCFYTMNASYIGIEAQAQHTTSILIYKAVGRGGGANHSLEGKAEGLDF